MARSPRAWLLALGAGVAVAVVLALTTGRWRDIGTWLADWLQTEVGVATAFLVTVALGGFLAERQGRRLRAWRSDPAVAVTVADTTASGAFTRKPVEHPSGVAASWAPVYGLLYLAAAGVALLLISPAVPITALWLAPVTLGLLLSPWLAKWSASNAAGSRADARGLFQVPASGIDQLSATEASALRAIAH